MILLNKASYSLQYSKIKWKKTIVFCQGHVIPAPLCTHPNTIRGQLTFSDQLEWQSSLRCIPEVTNKRTALRVRTQTPTYNQYIITGFNVLTGRFYFNQWRGRERERAIHGEKHRKKYEWVERRVSGRRREDGATSEWRDELVIWYMIKREHDAPDNIRFVVNIKEENWQSSCMFCTNSWLALGLVLH